MTMEPSETRVLVVDDSPLDRKLLTLHLGRAGYEPKLACDGLEAWELLTSAPNLFDVVLLDRSMPRMTGIELLERMKGHPRLRMVPVILQTAAVAREELLEGIRAGAIYYLTKPYDPGLLLEVVRTAANDYEETRSILHQLQQGIQTLSLLDRASFSIRTIEDARAVGAVLANLCPDPFSAVIGLTELLLNCVEHGNLGITYEEKSALKTREEWSAEVERRLLLPENQSKRVRVLFEREESVARFTFRDEGTGFDASKFMEIDPQRAFDTHGRGIAMARRLSFDSIDYLGCGNEVVATIRRPSAKSNPPAAADMIGAVSPGHPSSPGQGQS
ncbi:MAG TPA: response regulator [Thermoanaerobaculia bacterium]|nr:response regulator [Thermoanaerobaculia bacterium]